MENKFCSNCGTHIPPDSNFCTSCGQPVSTTQAEQPIQSTSPSEHAPKKPTNNKWFLIGAAVFIAIIAFFIFNKEDTPEKVAEDFVKHMANYDIQKVKDLLAHDADEYFKEGINWTLHELKDDPGFLDEEKEYAEENGYKIVTFKVTDVEEGEDYAYVYVQVTYNNGETENIDVDLLKENGEWKVEDTY